VTAGLLFGLVLSCATLPSGDVTGIVLRDGHPVGISREERRLLETARVASAAIGDDGGIASPDDTGWELFFSFTAWPQGREILNELLTERYTPVGGDTDLERGLSRVNAGYVAATISREVGWVSVDSSRFAGSIALNSAGWSRAGWGVWTDPGTGTALRFLPERIWEVRRWSGSAGTEGDGSAGAAGLGSSNVSGDLPRLLLTDLLSPSSSVPQVPPSPEKPRIGVVARLYRPTIPGVPAAILPEVVELLVGSDGGGSIRFDFSDERAARIALVPFRLQGRRIIETYGFLGTDDFDIIRFDEAVVIRGITLERLVLPGGLSERDQ